MRLTVKELIARAYEVTRLLRDADAALLREMAARLDVTTTALRQANAQLESQSLELKAAVAAEIEWEKAMMQAVGEDGIADVVSAIEMLKAVQVPEEKCDEDGITTSEFDLGWNACRAAMLSNESVSEPYKLRENIRREHAAWSQSTFGNVGPVGPLKHLSKEAIEAAEAPDDLSEWADMQFLLWDAQRRAGITDKQITLAMIEKLAINKARIWPEPKDGEPRLHITSVPQPEVPGE